MGAIRWFVISGDATNHMTIHDELFDPQNQSSIDRAIANAFTFLVHQTTRSNASSIKISGLEPRPVNVATEVDVACLSRRFQENIPSIVCLGNPGRLVPPSDPGPSVRLAVETIKLGQALHLDWTFGPRWNLAQILIDDKTCSNAAEVMVTILQRGGSVVVSSVIPANLLRLRLRNSSPLPATWPMLPVANLLDAWEGYPHEK